jgi:hypothetical protein
MVCVQDFSIFADPTPYFSAFRFGGSTEAPHIDTDGSLDGRLYRRVDGLPIIKGPGFCVDVIIDIIAG